MQQIEENRKSNDSLDAENQSRPNRERTRKNTVYIFGNERILLLRRIAQPRL